MISKEFLHGASLLPEQMKKWAIEQENIFGEPEEIRVRCGKPAVLIKADHIISQSEWHFTRENMTALIEKATKSSLHSASESIRKGYISSGDGLRIGICGTAVMEHGETATLRDFSSVNIRIPHENRGMADSVFDRLFKNGQFMNTLIVSPPGYGKTTLLRELIRKISGRGMNCGVTDERGEIAAVQNGICGFDIGVNTDVMDQMPKGDAAMVLLRTMNPQVIAMDEISDPEDMEAVRRINGCGVSILATMHGAGLYDIQRRTHVQKILEEHIFQILLSISISNGNRVVAIESLDI